MNKEEFPYEDILYAPHHVSKTHPSMKVSERAAQFAPFAALTGYEEAIMETGRITGQKIELEEDARNGLDERIHRLLEDSTGETEVMISYFQKDEKKQGGTYVTVVGKIQKVDFYTRELILEDGMQIRLEDVIEIEENE